MRRREFIALLGGTAATWPLAAPAQQPAMPVIGFASAGSPQGYEQVFAGFLKGLEETGYVQGRNVAIQVRWAEGRNDRLPSLVADLVQLKVNVIAATSTSAALAAKAATATIPVVFTTIADPVQIGLVASLNRPGGNMTGVSYLSVELGPKLLELLHDLVPKATIMALLVNPTNPNHETQSRNLQAAALKLGLQPHIVNASTERNFDAAFAELRQLRAEALMISQDGFFNSQSEQLGELSVRHAIPAIYVNREFAAAGGLWG
jgi:putative tryptophan/tyrosine transport system substrate-binding protein